LASKTKAQLTTKLRSLISAPVLAVLPSQAILFAIFVFPIALLFYLSLTNWTPMSGAWSKATVIGLDNYGEILQDARFIRATLRTLAYVGICATVEFIIALMLGLFFVRLEKGRGFIFLVILPIFIPPIVVGYTFYTLFYPGGAIDGILSLFVGRTMETNWLGRPFLASFAVIVTDVWQWTPIMFIFIYTGLLALPQEPFAAAKVLGASRLQVFRHLTLPSLKPFILIAILLRSLELFKFFDVPFTMTRGGPGRATETISIYMYYTGFKAWKLAYASSGAVMILIPLVIFLALVGRSIIRFEGEV
jgi:multiple sugar transport system permease protein